MENKWILTEERLPEKEGDYLVTIPLNHTPYVHILGFHDGKFFGDRGDEPNNKRVIAWMELPEPYSTKEKSIPSVCKKCKEKTCAFCIPPDKEKRDE